MQVVQSMNHPDSVTVSAHLLTFSDTLIGRQIHYFGPNYHQLRLVYWAQQKLQKWRAFMTSLRRIKRSWNAGGPPPLGLLRAPLSQRSCVFYSAAVQESKAAREKADNSMPLLEKKARKKIKWKMHCFQFHLTYNGGSYLSINQQHVRHMQPTMNLST